jgi:hypothetical protein
MSVDPVDWEAIAHGIRRLAEGDAQIADLCRQGLCARGTIYMAKQGG